MKSVAIVTDSCASIPENLMDELNIHWVPYYIHRGSEVLRDLVTITKRDFYDWLPSADQLPKTACPGAGDFLDLYKKIAHEGSVKNIVSIHMTSKGSGAYQAAYDAKEILRDIMPDINISIIDTLNVSMCHGWMVIEAARESMRGTSFDMVINKVQSMIPITKMLQTADTLKYLYMGGRIGKAKHLVASILDIKPIISMEDGDIVALGQGRTRKRVYQMMVDLMMKNLGAHKKIKIAYVHAAAKDEVGKLRLLVEKRIQPIETLVSELPPALGVHTGPGTIGFCYFPII